MKCMLLYLVIFFVFNKICYITVMHNMSVLINTILKTLVNLCFQIIAMSGTL